MLGGSRTVLFVYTALLCIYPALSKKMIRCAKNGETAVVNITLHADPVAMAMAQTEYQIMKPVGADKELNAYTPLIEMAHEVADGINKTLQPMGVQIRINASKLNVNGYEGLAYDPECSEGSPAQTRALTAVAYFLGTKLGGVGNRLIVWGCPPGLPPLGMAPGGLCGKVVSVMYQSWDLTKDYMKQAMLSFINPLSLFSLGSLYNSQFERGVCQYVDKCLVGVSRQKKKVATNVGYVIKGLTAIRHIRKKPKPVIGYDDYEVYDKNYVTDRRTFHLNQYAETNADVGEQ